MATYQGAVSSAKPARPHPQRSRFQQPVGPLHHHETPAEAAISAGPTGPFVSVASARNDQKTAAAAFDGPRANSQSANWQPTTRKARVASVVASFDSTTTIGAVARIKAAQSPTRSPSIRRPQPRTSRQVPVPASAETSRAPNGLSPPSAVPAIISQ